MVQVPGDGQPQQHGGSREMDPRGEAGGEQRDIYGLTERMWEGQR